MHRRQFFTTTGWAALAAGLPFSPLMASTHEAPVPAPPRLRKPAALREGATVALVAPGSVVASFFNTAAWMKWKFA